MLYATRSVFCFLQKILLVLSILVLSGSYLFLYLSWAVIDLCRAMLSDLGWSVYIRVVLVLGT